MGKTANSLFLFTSFFRHFKCDHHFPFNSKEKIKQHNNIHGFFSNISKMFLKLTNPIKFYTFEYISIEVIAVFVVSLVRISVVRMCILF